MSATGDRPLSSIMIEGAPLHSLGYARKELGKSDYLTLHCSKFNIQGGQFHRDQESTQNKIRSVQGPSPWWAGVGTKTPEAE